MQNRTLLQRLYIHNFRCFENFEFKPEGQSASLLIGKNGSGKSNLMHALALFQAIGRGRTRLGELVTPADFTRGRSDTPMRFEIEVLLRGKLYTYQGVDLMHFPASARSLRLI